MLLLEWVTAKFELVIERNHLPMPRLTVETLPGEAIISFGKITCMVTVFSLRGTKRCATTPDYKVNPYAPEDRPNLDQ